MPGASRELAELIRWMTVQQVPRMDANGVGPDGKPSLT